MNQVVDEVYLNGVLSGILLGVAGLWLLWLANALWRASLRPFAEASPFELTPSGWRARYRGEGVVDGKPVDIELVGGLAGPIAIVERGDRTERIPLAGRPAEAWYSALE